MNYQAGKNLEWLLEEAERAVIRLHDATKGSGRHLGAEDFRPGKPTGGGPARHGAVAGGAALSGQYTHA